MLAGALTQLVPPGSYDRFRTVFDWTPLWGKVAFATISLWATLMLAPEGVAPFIYFQF